MPFAANGRISTDEFEGAIDITEEQYMQALEGMQTGLVVTVDDGFKVAAPPEPVPDLPPEPTIDELKAMALGQRDGLLALAGLRVAPLQDAVDLDTATAADTANLTLWKQYRVAVNRVSAQAGFPTTIDWPVQPV